MNIFMLVSFLIAVPVSAMAADSTIYLDDPWNENVSAPAQTKAHPKPLTSAADSAVNQDTTVDTAPVPLPPRRPHFASDTSTDDTPTGSVTPEAPATRSIILAPQVHSGSIDDNAVTSADVPLPPRRPHFKSDDAKSDADAANDSGDEKVKKLGKKETPPVAHCTSSFDGASAADKAVLNRMENAAKGSLSSSGWRSPRGTAFAFSTSGPIVMTIRGLPNKALDALYMSSMFYSKGDPVTEENRATIRGLLDQGSIQFNATLCLKADGKFTMSLVGTGLAGGKVGQIALIPSQSGMKASGQIAGTDVHEQFARASH